MAFSRISRIIGFVLRIVSRFALSNLLPRNRRAVTALAALGVAFAISATSLAQTAIIYVDINNGALDPPNFGQNGWGEETAYRFLQDALGGASALLSQVDPPPPDTVHLWVAMGTYKPGTQSGDRFTIPSSVRVFGGFVGNEATFEERLLTPAGTILNGDVNDNDTPGDIFSFNDNNQFVVTFENANDLTRLDNVTIVGGGAAGVLFNTSDAVLSNCIIRRNGNNGALMNAPGAQGSITSTPRVINCRFYENSLGTALTINPGVRATVVNSLFRDNIGGNGGAVAINGGEGFNFTPAEAVLINCTIAENLANLNGGGIYRKGIGTSQVKNCIVWGNTDSGGSNSDESAQIHHAFGGQHQRDLLLHPEPLVIRRQREYRR